MLENYDQCILFKNLCDGAYVLALDNGQVSFCVKEGETHRQINQCQCRHKNKNNQAEIMHYVKNVKNKNDFRLYSFAI